MNKRPALDPDLINALRELADGDDSFLHEILESFESDSAAVAQELRAAVVFTNRVAFGRAAHALASSAMNIGAMDLATICHESEIRMASAGATPTATDLDRIVDELNRVLFESRDLSLESYCSAVRM
jgi:HPt (histidine-containing phosphotransfer) domain-containing protein